MAGFHFIFYEFRQCCNTFGLLITAVLCVNNLPNRSKVEDAGKFQRIQNISELAIFAFALDTGSGSSIVASFVGSIGYNDVLWGILENHIPDIKLYDFSEMCHTIYAAKDAIPVVSNDFSALNNAANPGDDDGGCFHTILLNRTGLAGI